MAKVKVILKGYFKWVKLNVSKASSTVVLIQDQGKNILFDTGSFFEESALNKKLRLHWITPDEIDYVVISHMHPDHIGNMHLFKKAEFIVHSGRYVGNEHRFGWDMFRNKIKITENVILYKTPGHTADSVSLLVKTKKGTIGVAGDLFVKRQEEKVLVIDNKVTFRRFRRKMIKKCDYIIPGHGDMFKVEK